MAVPKYEYMSCHPLQRNLLARLTCQKVEWVETVGGNGTLNADISLPRNPAVIAQLRAALEPDEAAFYVRDAEGNYPFGGPIIEADWWSDSRVVKVTAQSWRAWMYNVFLAPKVDLSGDNTYGWTNKDQLQIARELAVKATIGGTADGRPAIAVEGASASGVMRDLNLKGLDFKYVGEALDSIAQRDRGFDWDILVRGGSDGLPELAFASYFPERGSLISTILLKNTPGGANFEVKDKIDRSAAERRTRVWTTGSTETPQYAVDSDPELEDGYTLLRETHSNYSTVVERTTLASHARAERSFRSPKLHTLPLQVKMQEVDVTAFSVGDRVRLLYRDEWVTLDLASVRVIERKMMPTEETGLVDVVLDLNDTELPEIDA